MSSTCVAKFKQRIHGLNLMLPHKVAIFEIHLTHCIADICPSSPFKGSPRSMQMAQGEFKHKVFCYMKIQ